MLRDKTVSSLVLATFMFFGSRFLQLLSFVDNSAHTEESSSLEIVFPIWFIILARSYRDHILHHFEVYLWQWFPRCSCSGHNLGSYLCNRRYCLDFHESTLYGESHQWQTEWLLSEHNIAYYKLCIPLCQKEGQVCELKRGIDHLHMLIGVLFTVYKFGTGPALRTWVIYE